MAESKWGRLAVAVWSWGWLWCRPNQLWQRGKEGRPAADVWFDHHRVLRVQWLVPTLPAVWADFVYSTSSCLGKRRGLGQRGGRGLLGWIGYILLPVDLGHRTLTVRDGAYEQNSCLSTHLFVWLSLSLSAFWGRAR